MPPYGQGRVRDTQDDTRPDRIEGQTSDHLRQDAYRRQQFERVERHSVNSIRSQNFDNPFNHLDQARQAWHAGGFESAEGEYFAAIRAADKIDQREVAAEREQVKKQLNTERDPAKRRELVQYDMTLHDMQRAPGVVRANLGLAYLRAASQVEGGRAQEYQVNGVRMLLEAQRLDPEMERDPNFVRHLEMLKQGAASDGNRGQGPGGVDQRGRQPGDQRGGQPTDRRTQSAGERTQPTDQGTSGDQRGGQPTDQRTQPTDQDGRADTADDTVDQDGTQSTDRRTQSVDGTGTRTTDQGTPGDQGAGKPTDQVTLPTGTNRPDAQNFDNPFAHIQKANEALVKEGKLSPASKAEYEAAIKAADNIDRNYLLEQAKQLQEALVKAYPPETQQKVVQLESQRDEMLKKLSPETQAKLAELDKKFAAATTDAEKLAIRTQIKELAPDLVSKQEEIDVLTAQPKAILEQLKLIESLMNSSALTRGAYANALLVSGNTTDAKTLLEQVAKLDPNAAKDAKFQEMAKKAGLTLTPDGQAATASDAPTGGKPDSQAERRDTAQGPGQSTEPDVGDLLKKASETENSQGFAAAKPLYEQAIAAADKVDTATIDKQLTEIQAKLTENEPVLKELRSKLTPDQQKKLTELEAQLAQASTQEAQAAVAKQMTELAPDYVKKLGEQIQLQQLGVMLTQYRHAPFITRFRYGIAQNNSGDHEGAKATLEKAATKDPEEAKRPEFKAAMDMVSKKEKITDEALQKAAASQGGGSAAVDDPTDHIKAAVALQEKGNAKSAEEEWKKAIAAADTLFANPAVPENLKKAVQEAEQELAQAKAKQDPTKPDTLLAASEAQKKVDGLKELQALPVVARKQAAIFYLENGKPDEAKALLEQALQKDPSLATQEHFKKLAEIARDNSKGTLEKSLDFLKKAKNEILSDGGAGLVALGVSAITPGKYFKLPAAILAAGATKHGINLALGSDQTSLSRNMLWGGVDAVAFLSGAAVQRSMLGKFEGKLTTQALKDLVAKGGIAEAEKLALLEGKSGLSGLQAATQMLTQHAQAKEAAAMAELSSAIKTAPFWKKPLLYAQGHAPLLWRIPNQSLAGFKTQYTDYLASRGSGFNYLNPFNAFASVGNYSTLRNLEARTFWNRYRMDAASIGTTSLVYRGTHEAAKVGSRDPNTEKPYSAYDAIANTGIGTMTDAVTGPLLVAGFRSMGGFFTRHSGAVAEVNPLVRPALSAESSLYAKVAHPFKLTGYGAQKYLVKPIGDASARAGTWLSSEARIPTGLRTAGTGFTLFSPRLFEAYGSWEKMDEYEKVMAEISKPLTDKSPSVNPDPPADGGSLGLPGSARPVQTPDAPAKPSKTDGASGSTQPQGDSSGGLPE